MNKYYIMDAKKCYKKIENSTVQTIYIDPPYNTKAKNFEYNDNKDNWNEWIEDLLFNYKPKLKEEGFIFISIDDNKLFELKLICDKVFGKKNYLGLFITRQATRSNSKHINTIHEYILAYCKNKEKSKKFEILRLKIPMYKDVLSDIIEKIRYESFLYGVEKANKLLKELIKKYENDDNFTWLKNYNQVDENGEIYFPKDLSTPSEPKELYIEEIDLYLPKLKSRGWSSKTKILKLYKENKLAFKDNRPYEKHYLKESKDSAMSILNYYSRQGKHDLENLGLDGIFTTAKPVELIKYLIQLSTNSKDIVLDFFAGSGTTAQAVLELNEEEKTEREFLLCQIKEKVNNNSKIKKILEEKNLDVDISSITLLRLEKLKEKYEFEYNIIYEN